MKFSAISLGLMAGLITAAPTPTIQERVTISDTPIGYASQNGGTTGGAGGSTTTVSTYAQFTAAAKGDSKKVIIISKPISTSAAAVRPSSNTSIIGKNSSVKLTGFGILVKDVKNVIIRNIAVSRVVESNGDALAVQKATNVWIDHVDVSSDMTHGKDYYDGLIDLTHAADFITVSNSYIHDHYKASLIGHSDSNKAEDTGKLRVTFHGNYWKNINSRGPSLRFGTAHFFNNFYSAVADGINTRLGAQVLVENNVFVDGKKALYSTDAGYAVESGNDFGGAKNEALKGKLTSVPYKYSKVAASAVKSAIVGKAGNTLSF